MILLGNATEKVQLVLEAAPAANQLAWTAAFVKGAGAVTSRFGPRVGVTDGTTPVDVLPGEDNYELVLKHLTVYNGDTADAVAILQKNVGGTVYPIRRQPLAPRQSLTYSAGEFEVSDVYKPTKVIVLKAGVLTMTNAEVNKRFAANVTTSNILADLSGYREIRMRGNCSAASASVNNPRLRVEYYTTWSTTLSNFLRIGATADLEFSVSAVGWKDTGWLELATNARINDCCLGLMELGGDAAADPAVMYLELLVR